MIEIDPTREALSREAVENIANYIRTQPKENQERLADEFEALIEDYEGYNCLIRLFLDNHLASYHTQESQKVHVYVSVIPNNVTSLQLVWESDCMKIRWEVNDRYEEMLTIVKCDIGHLNDTCVIKKLSTHISSVMIVYLPDDLET